MIRNSIMLGIAALVIASTLDPSAANAGHYRFAPLLPVVDQLHCSAERFEQVACRHPITPVDRQRISHLYKRICRLQEGIQTGKPLGRVKADLNSVSVAMKLVARRVRVSCAINEDVHLMRMWQRVCNEFELVQQIANERCLHVHAAPPVRDHFSHHNRGRHAPDNYGAWRHRQPDWSRGDYRYHERHDRGGPSDYRGAPRVDYDRQARSTAPVWLDALMAALAR